MNYTSPLVQRHGAASLANAALLDAAGVAWHYGNPLGEQRVVERGSAVVDRSQRRVVAVMGPDAPEFLNNLLSQKLDDVPVGYSAAALDLDMQGRVLHHADVTRVEEGFYLDVPAAQCESFRDYLQKMVFWSKVTVDEADVAVLTVLGAPLPPPSCAVVVREVEWLGPRRSDILVPRGELTAAVRELESAGGTLVGLMAYTAERVKARDPELAADLDDKSIPHEVPQWIGREPSVEGALECSASVGRRGAVHLHKGCYRGQETVARVENLGRSPRVMVLLQLDGSSPTRPEPGQEVTAGGRRVGRLGTVVDDCDYGPIALALIKRSALRSPAEPPVEFLIGDTSAQVDPDSLPEEAGPQAGREAVNRLRGR